MNNKSNITLINMNLMYAYICGKLDFQRYLPLGVLYLLSVLDKEGFKINFLDHQMVDPEDYFNVDKLILDTHNSDIIGISTMANLLPFTLLLCKRIKEKDQNKVIILGGIGPSAVSKEILNTFPFIDIIVIGEGEKTIIEVMKCLCNNEILDSVKGIHYQENGVLHFNPPRERITDLDAIPLPAYSYINLDDYDAAPSIITSRGCPYKCTFCSVAPMWGNRVYFRSISNVLHEMKFLHDRHGKSTFIFQDDNFVLNRKRAIKFCESIDDEKLAIKWKCFGRINLMDEMLMEKMASSGCIQIRYGIESGSNKILEKIKKGFTIELAEEIVKKSLKYFPSVHVSFMWGYPFETEEDFQQSLYYMLKFKNMGATVLSFLLSPLPISQIYTEYKDTIDYSDELHSEFVISGLENRIYGMNVIKREYVYVYEFIKKYPTISPGFFHYNYEKNILPKLILILKAGLFFRTYKDHSSEIKIDL